MPPPQNLGLPKRPLFKKIKMPPRHFMAPVMPPRHFMAPVKFFLPAVKFISLQHNDVEIGPRQWSNPSLWLLLHIYFYLTTFLDLKYPTNDSVVAHGWNSYQLFSGLYRKYIFGLLLGCATQPSAVVLRAASPTKLHLFKTQNALNALGTLSCRTHPGLPLFDVVQFTPL